MTRTTTRTTTTRNVQSTRMVEVVIKKMNSTGTTKKSRKRMNKWKMQKSLSKKMLYNNSKTVPGYQWYQFIQIT